MANSRYKFRAWDVKNKAWCKFYTNVDCMRHLGNDNLAVTQFTGLLDKNGKEVFEGDVVRSCQPIIDERTLINTVIFKKGGFYLNCEKQLDYLLGDYDPQFIEVIGNIYENGDAK